MTFQGLPTTAAQASEALTRPNLRGTVTPDLVLWARNKGLKARFWSSQPDELIKLIDQQKPVIVQINAGITGLPYKLGHFAVAVGYLPEGIVANSGGVQQSIIPWSEFLTRWFAFGNLAILIEKPGEESQIQDLRPQSPVSPAPLITLDRPQ
jgi:hypothetical protein